MRLRVAFAKKKEAKYIAHLDLARVFERALRRAGIPVAYSEGFNPHPKISFGSALAVGVEGECEYVDLVMEKDCDQTCVLGSLQEQLPKGIIILEARVVNNKARALMAVLNSASYQLKMPVAQPIRTERLQNAIVSWMEREHVNFWRFSKKGRVEKDIRPWVKSLSGEMQEEMVILDLETEISNSGSVRPEEVAASLCDLEQLPLDLERMRIRRTGIYITKGGKRETPFEEKTGL